MAHPDNTIKALKGEETFVERWLCRWGWHRWGKWSEPKNVSYYFIQTCTCTDCGRTKAKKISNLTTV